MATEQTDQELEHELASLLDVETFDPPAEFRAQALLTDPAIYEEADADWQGWWVKQAEQLDWFKKWDTVLDDSNPPFYKWFVGGQLNVSYNCLDRHVEAGLGDRVAFHWHGEEGDERDDHLRRPAPRRAAVRERAQGPRRPQGRHRRDLPADDPRGRRRDARVRADRRAAQRRVRRLLASRRSASGWSSQRRRR